MMEKCACIPRIPRKFDNTIGDVWLLLIFVFIKGYFGVTDTCHEVGM